MLISQLMERNQMSKYSIIIHLMNAEKPLTLKSLKEFVNLSVITLEKYITEMSELNITNDLTLKVSIKSSYIHLEMDSKIQLNDIIAFFLKDSIKYQILVYLFNHQHFSIPTLANELLVSEATLNRNLAALNKDLSEFDIQIRNGRLRGPFHQIVYFYYHLFLLAWTYPKQRKIITDYQLESYLSYFEHINRQPFHDGGNHRLAFWMYVSQKLSIDEERNYDILNELFHEYQKKSFYIKFRRPLLQYHMRLAKNFKEGDIILDVVFLMSHRVLIPAINEQILGHGGRIMKSVNLVLNALNDLTQKSKHAKAELLYEAGQSFSRMTFFKGAILSQHFSSIYSEYEDVTNQLMMKIINEQMEMNQEDLGDLYSLMCASWMARLEELNDTQIEMIIVALRLDRLNLPSQKIMLQLRSSLEIQRQLTIEWYHPDLTYDYLISDRPEETDHPKLTYYLKGKPAQYDLGHLHHIFNELIAAKL